MRSRLSTPRGGAAGRPRFADRLVERRNRHRQRSTLYRVAYAVGGMAVLLAGVAMLVLPGPGLLVTGAGLAMLALEFVWAERLLSQATEKLQSARARTARRRAGPRR